MKEKKIFEARELPEGERVMLRKDRLGWRIVHPLKDHEGKPVWMNILFGGKRNLVYLIIMLAFLGLLYLGINELVSNYKIIAEHPCNFCNQCSNAFISNLSSLNLSGVIANAKESIIPL